jgi:ribosomal protein S18 acetylase RimI-like enzyme
MDVVVTIVDQVTDELVSGITRLLPQLLDEEKVVTAADLEAVIHHPNVFLFIATIGDTVVGTAQLSIYPRTYGPKAWIDGVIVDSEQRGKGIATIVMDAVLAHARKLNIEELSLTSSPKREAANHLYTKLGYEKYDTNYYRYVL